MTRRRPGALVQARAGSRRLPGKVLADLAGRPLLLRVVERVRRARTLSRVAVATSTEPADDAVAALCEEHGVPCFRGPEDDVLGRLVSAAELFEMDPVVRVTGDCPFVDDAVIDALVAAHVTACADYTTYGTPTVHEGIDPFSLRWLRATHRRALGPEEREHPLLVLRRRPGSARILRLRAPAGHEVRPGLRLSVDEPEDLEFARGVYGALGRDGGFDTADLLALVDARPELARLNAHVARVVPKGIA